MFPMAPLFASKRILIAGASNRLGLSLTRTLLGAGAQVIAVSENLCPIPAQKGLTVIQACLSNVGAISALAEVGNLNAAIVMVENPVFVPNTFTLAHMFETLSEQQAVQINALSGLPACLSASGGGTVLFVESVPATALPEPWRTIASSWNLSARLSADGWSVHLAPLGVEARCIELPDLAHRPIESASQRELLTEEVVERLTERVLAALIESSQPASAAVWLAEAETEVTQQT